MKINIDTDYLDPIEIDSYQWVTVDLPDGMRVSVFSDKVYVATPDDVLKHKDGRKVWDARDKAA